MTKRIRVAIGSPFGGVDILAEDGDRYRCRCLTCGRLVVIKRAQLLLRARKGATHCIECAANAPRKHADNAPAVSWPRPGQTP